MNIYLIIIMTIIVGGYVLNLIIEILNLKELKPEDLDPVKIFIKDMKKIQKEKGYKRGWIYYQVRDKFGEAIAEQHFPKRYVPPWIASRA